MAYLVGLVLMGFFGWVMFLGGKGTHALKKYEFENRTSGGVVQFPTYEDSLKHNRKKGRAGLLVFVGALGAILGFLIFFMTFLLKNHIH